MKIQVPLNSLSDVPELIRLGGDEFYMGYLPPGFTPIMEQAISRRPGVTANPVHKEWIARQMRIIKQAGKKIFVTFNEHFYPVQWHKSILSGLAWLSACGLDGVILADPGLLRILLPEFPGLRFIAGTGLEVTNSRAAAFLHTLGFSRIILPRGLRIPEIREIIADNPGLECEVFIKNDGCPNRDGFCCYVHGAPGGEVFGQACRQLPIPSREGLRKPYFAASACGACSLFDFKEPAPFALKIVGRDKPCAAIRQDLVFIKCALDNLTGCTSRQEFSRLTKTLYRKIYTQECSGECYYR